MAQGFDAQDPVGDGNWPSGERGCRAFGFDSPYSMGGGDNNKAVDFTPFFMGPIHPRPKHILGRRMAMATAAQVYGDAAIGWTGTAPSTSCWTISSAFLSSTPPAPCEILYITLLGTHAYRMLIGACNPTLCPISTSSGPVIKNCSVSESGVSITFNEQYLRDDAVMVFPPIGQLPGGLSHDIHPTTKLSLCRDLPGNASNPLCSSFGGVRKRVDVIIWTRIFSNVSFSPLAAFTPPTCMHPPTPRTRRATCSTQRPRLLDADWCL